MNDSKLEERDPMIRVSFWEDTEDALPHTEDVDALNSALACEKIKEKYPNAEIISWEWI